jgi:cytochrome P450
MPLLGARGNLISFVRNPTVYMSRLYEEYGEVVTLARGTPPYIFVFSPEYNRLVLGDTSLFDYLDVRSSPLRVPKDSSLARLFSGLIQMSGDRHRSHRRAMLPAFHKQRIESYIEGIAAVTERKLAAWAIDRNLDLYEQMRELALSIAIKVLVGLDPEGGGDELRRLLERWMGLVFSLRSVLLPFKLRGLEYSRLIAVSDELEKRILSLIERKRRAISDQNDVLSQLIHAENGDNIRLTDEEIVGHIAFLFFAGHTTTASALSWTLCLLDQHPHILNDLLDEIEGKLDGTGISGERLEDLPLMEAVLKESMRLLPPVMWSSRKSNARFNIGEYEFPSGTRIIHSAYITHRVARCFRQPYKFLPERWLDTRPGPYEYMPFSAGTTTCLGLSLAMVEMKIVLASILQRCQLVLPPETRIDLGGIMICCPKTGMPVLVAPRGRRTTRNDVRGNIRRAVDLN